jgi:LysR family nitrogen assimilation transcriptional regulator
MHYRHLYYFVRIVEAGSFSQAARTIHVAQPALSQQIADLEASLGVRLSPRPLGKNSPTKHRRSCANTRISLGWFVPTRGR